MRHLILLNTFCFKTLLIGMLYIGLSQIANHPSLAVHALPEKKKVSFKQALTELKKEGKASLEAQKWLRLRSNYNTRVDVDFEVKDVISALQKKQDRNPAIDGYVRWQLLSFLKRGDWDDMDSRTYYRIVEAMPALEPLPKVPPQMTKSWQAIHKKKNPSKKLTEHAQENWKVFHEKIEQPWLFRTEPVLRYRKLVEEKISLKSAMKTYAKLKNLNDLMAAGHDCYAFYAVSFRKGVPARFTATQMFAGLASTKDLNSRIISVLRKQISSIGTRQAIFSEEVRSRPGKGDWVGGRVVDSRMDAGLKQLGGTFEKTINRE